MKFGRMNDEDDCKLLRVSDVGDVACWSVVGARRMRLLARSLILCFFGFFVFLSD